LGPYQFKSKSVLRLTSDLVSHYTDAELVVITVSIEIPSGFLRVELMEV
jgi:hypothetical protein